MIKDLTSSTPGENRNSSGDRALKIAALWLPSTIVEVCPKVARDFQIKRIGTDTDFHSALNVIASDSEKDVRHLLRRARQASAECKIYEMPGAEYGAIILQYSDIHERLLIESKDEALWEKTNEGKPLSIKDFTDIVEDIYRDEYEIGLDRKAASVEVHSLIERTGIKSHSYVMKEYLDPIRQKLERLYKKSAGDSTSRGKKSLLLERYEAAKEAFAGRLKWNELTMSPELDGQPLDFDTIQIKLARETGMDFPEAHVRSVVLELATEHSYDPVKDYLEAVYERHKDQSLDNAAQHLLGTPNPLHNIYLKRHLIGSVARRYQPGCKMDTMLVLKGEQGIQKSTFFSVLYGGDWFDSTPADSNPKDELLRLHMHWCNEWGELDGVMSKKDAARMKAELSNPKDTFRPPYGRNSKRYPRRFVNVGSTNKDSFLVDSTGDRRFWVIDLGSRLINLDKVRELRDQVWGAAVAAYKAGEQWWLTAEEQKQSSLANKAYAETDSWEDYILAFLGQELAKGVTFVTTAQCLKDSLLGIEPSKQTKADQNRCADILRRSGWTKSEKKIAGQARKVWLPPVKKVATPPGGDQGVATAETQEAQAIQPLNIEVATPYQEKIFRDDEVLSVEKKVVEKVATFDEPKPENPCSVVDVAVATPPVATPQALKVGDMVSWSECPAHCSSLAPFEIMAIDGDYAKLDLFEKPVPTSQLSRANT